MFFDSRFRSPPLVAAMLLVAAVVVFFAVRAQKVPAYRVEAKLLTQSVVATGRVISLSRAQVGSQITGVVIERRVAEGDAVVPGDVLVVLRADDLAAQVRAAEAALARLQESTRPQAQVASREAQAQLDQALREVERRRNLFERGLIARESLEQAEQAVIGAQAAAQTARLAAESFSAGGPEERNLREQLAAARASLEKTVIRSEVAGTVLTRNAEPGDLVQPGRVLFDIARAGDTEIIVPFDEKNLSVLQVGQRATCIADAFPNNAFSAQITLIAPRIDPQRGTVDVRLKVQPVPEFLRQDMTVSVTVQTGLREHALAVPNDALMNIRGDEAYVLIAREGKAHRVPVRLGLRGLMMTELVDGVSGGDVVLVPGEQAVADGDRVRAVEGSAAGSNTQTEPQASSQS